MPKCLTCHAEAAILYCSNRCQQEYRWLKTKEEIDRTGQFPVTINGKAAKRYLLEKFGNVCSICSIAVWRGTPVPLVLDHVDGNADNWLVINLRHVCPNCDAQLPTFKSRNRGNGRKARRDRYQLCASAQTE
jgi:hypothetical protein